MEAGVGYETFAPRERVERIVSFLGNNLSAELLGVSGSQPARWRTGKERVSGENLRRVVDLDYVVTRLLMTWEPTVARSWLDGDNPHLGGRPIDVIRLRGPAAIIPALDAEDAGAYA